MNNSPHIPNEDTYRPLLGKDVNHALILLTEKKNKDSLKSLSPKDYLEKAIEHWWKQEFPDEPFPGKTKPYHKDLDF